MLPTSTSRGGTGGLYADRYPVAQGVAQHKGTSTKKNAAGMVFAVHGGHREPHALPPGGWEACHQQKHDSDHPKPFNMHGGARHQKCVHVSTN